MESKGHHLFVMEDIVTQGNAQAGAARSADGPADEVA
jgi:hypothetical protein